MNKNCLFILLILFFIVSCSKKHKVINHQTNDFENKLIQNKINGVSYVGMPYSIDSSHFLSIKKINATWITTMPFGFIKDGNSTVNYNVSWQWIGEKKEGIINTIKLAHENGIKVMIKPHIWITGSWPGDLEFSNETDWLNFEKTYSDYIFSYAKLADSMRAESFCVGVELRKSAIQRFQFWEKLIDSVKSIYSGKITYASNWDNYDKIKFWNKLDFIGIDAYFPVSESKTPTFEECYSGWEKDYNNIKTLSNKLKLKVIFTEYGYRNVDFTGKEPWDDKHQTTFNIEGQNNAYNAIYSRFWSEPWFEGGFLWKWFPNYEKSGGLKNNRFTPQNKPVEKIIKKNYSL